MLVAALIAMARQVWVDLQTYSPDCLTLYDLGQLDDGTAAFKSSVAVSPIQESKFTSPSTQKTEVKCCGRVGERAPGGGAAYSNKRIGRRYVVHSKTPCSSVLLTFRNRRRSSRGRIGVVPAATLHARPRTQRATELVVQRF